MWPASSYSSPSRSGYRGNNPRRSYPDNRSDEAPQLPPDRDIEEHLNVTPIQALSRPDVPQSDDEPVKPQSVKYIGSYNWVDEPHPTIIVPGSPPEWSDRPFPYRVPYDKDVRFVDQNSYRMGTASCLLPLFRAVDVVPDNDGDEEEEEDSMDWSAVDFVTDRNGLRKLMRWLQYEDPDPDCEPPAEPPREFRIDLQLAGRKTVLMHRWEKRTREQAEFPKSGCGMNFERQSTRPAKGCERSTGHHRIIQYTLDGLNMVVRFEVDACLPEPAPPSWSTPASPRAHPATSIDALTSQLSALATTTTAPAAAAPIARSTDIDVLHRGTRVPQSALVELTTRGAARAAAFDWTEQFPQLLLSATPHLFLAVHERGVFGGMKRHELGTPEFRAVEGDRRTQRMLRQLVQALRDIQALLVDERGRAGGVRRLSLVCRQGELGVFERTSGVGDVPQSELGRFKGSERV